VMMIITNIQTLIIVCHFFHFMISAKIFQHGA